MGDVDIAMREICRSGWRRTLHAYIRLCGTHTSATHGWRRCPCPLQPDLRIPHHSGGHARGGTAVPVGGIAGSCRSMKVTHRNTTRMATVVQVRERSRAKWEACGRAGADMPCGSIKARAQRSAPTARPKPRRPWPPPEQPLRSRRSSCRCRMRPPVRRGASRRSGLRLSRSRRLPWRWGATGMRGSQRRRRHTPRSMRSMMRGPRHRARLPREAPGRSVGWRTRRLLRRVRL